MPFAGHADLRLFLIQECYLPKKLLVSPTAPEAARRARFGEIAKSVTPRLLVRRSLLPLGCYPGGMVDRIPFCIHAQSCTTGDLRKCQLVHITLTKHVHLSRIGFVP